MNHQSPEFREAFTPSAANDAAPAASPDREALLAWERHKKSDVAAGRVAPVGVPPTTAEYPLDYVPDPMPVLDTVEKVEEAVRSALLVRTGNRAAAMRILGGMHSAGGRLRSGDALTVEQFRDAMLRLNVNPADDAVVAAVFRKHDTNGDGSLDYQEFVRYLLPGDFETTSPREYRKAYEGYSEPTRAVVSGMRPSPDPCPRREPPPLAGREARSDPGWCRSRSFGDATRACTVCFLRMPRRQVAPPPGRAELPIRTLHAYSKRRRPRSYRASRGGSRLGAIPRR